MLFKTFLYLCKKITDEENIDHSDIGIDDGKL